LLIDDALPATMGERAAFLADVAPLRAVPTAVAALLPAVAETGEPLEGLRSALSLVASAHGMRPNLDLDHAQRRADALLLCAVTPTILCALHRLRSGLDVVAPDPTLGWAANYLWMM